MTVNASTRRSGPYSGTGLPVGYSFNYKVFAATDLLVVTAVIATGVTTNLVLDSGYSVSLNVDQDANPGGTVFYMVAGVPTALPIGFTLTIVGDLPFTQPADITNLGGFYPQVIEDALDREVMLIQQTNDATDRALLLNVATNQAFSTQLPAPVPTSLLGWAPDGLSIVNYAVGIYADTAALIVALASSIGSSLIGFIQNAAGAVARTLQAKIREIKGFTANDFGAVGDGVTNDRAAIALADTRAVALGRELVFAAENVYLINSNITIASPCFFEAGAMIRVATGVTVLFTKPATQRWAQPVKIFDIVGTGKVQWLDCSPTVYPDWWTTNAVPATTDMATALQRAADCVVNGADSYCPSKTSGGAGRCTMLLTTKRYLSSVVQDWNQRDYLLVRGVGRAELVSNSTGYIVDMSSCYRCSIEDVTFTSYTARAGIVLNRCTSNPYALFNEFNRVEVYVGTNAALNAGQGAYGIVNCRAEQNVWNNCDIRGDVVRYMTQSFDANFAPVSGTQDNTITSLVVSTFNQCNFVRHTKLNYGSIINGAIDWHDINCYYGTVSTASGTIDYAMLLENLSDFEISGTMETTAGFAFFRRPCYFGRINLTPQAAALGTGGILNFDSAFSTGLVNADLTINITSAIAGGRVIKWSGAGPSCQLFGITLRTGNSALIIAVDVSATNSAPFGITVITDKVTPSVIASASFIAPTVGESVFRLTGTTAIDTIGQVGFAGRPVMFIPAAACSTTTAGNIANAVTFVANVPRWAVYDTNDSKWHFT